MKYDQLACLDGHYKDFMKKELTEQQLNIMKQSVDQIIDLTYFCLRMFKTLDDELPDYIFIHNIIKNYMGNIVYHGVDRTDIKAYRKMADAFILELKDYFDTTAEIMMKENEKLKKEAH